MSKFEAPLTTFTLSPHENADSLSIAQVGGWTCVVKTEDFINETLGVYLPLDSIADENHPLLFFLGGKRVKTVKLRGVISQGLLLPFSKVIEYMKTTLGMSEASIEKVSILGKDFVGILRVRRWEDSTKLSLGGDAETPNPLFNKYTDIENIKNFTNVIVKGEHINLQEKLHGSSSRFSLINNELMIGSRNIQLKIEAEKEPNSIWHYVYRSNNLKDKLELLAKITGSSHVGIYGEIVGKGIQDLHYNHNTPYLYVYDIVVDGNYVSPDLCEHYCKELSLTHIPILFKGQYTENLLQLRLGKSTLADHVREGIIIKPMIPRTDPALGRVVLKVISEDYLMRKNPKDAKDI
jgi:RNA ligase (TIGR02306 family)